MVTKEVRAGEVEVGGEDGAWDERGCHCGRLCLSTGRRLGTLFLTP